MKEVSLEKWRSAVISRDGGKCVKCGTASSLHAHHVKSYAHHPELRHETDNGTTLCKPCHKEEHRQWPVPRRVAANRIPDIRSSFNLSTRHSKLLKDLAGKLDQTMTTTIERALEALEEKEVERNAKVLP